MPRTHACWTFLGAVIITVGLAYPAGAQTSGSAGSSEVDTRWLPWMGCWQLWEEQVEREAGRGAEFPDRTFVCMTAGTDGARLTASANGQTLVERTLRADGERRPVTEPECTGWEAREWSADGHRLFTRAELTCGDATPRRVSGISFFSNRSTWVDMQVVSVGERQHLEIRRYNPVTEAERRELVGTTHPLPAEPREIRDARASAAESLVLPSVREAAAKADARIVEAMLAEAEPRLNLDAATLIELDDAGVDGDVIDLLVALSYPEQFVVERRTGSSGGGGGGWASGGFGSPAYYDPVWYGDLYPYYLTPLGYGGWGRGYSPYFYGAAASPFIALQGDESVRTGRAVEGRGYTRVVPRTFDADTGRTAQRRGGNNSGPRTSPSGGRSGGSRGVSSGGYTRGGGGGGGGRTAQPRR